MQYEFNGKRGNFLEKSQPDSRQNVNRMTESSKGKGDRVSIDFRRVLIGFTTYCKN